MKILIFNWQDRENPQAGGAEIHLHEIFGPLASRGHGGSLLGGGRPGGARGARRGGPGCAPRARLDGIEVTRVGTRTTFSLRARGGYRQHFAERPLDVLVEDI